MQKEYYIYILSSGKNWTLYIWVTNNLKRRTYEHKNFLVEWFTKKYWIKNLVHYEKFDDIRNAIEKEKKLKKWNREWKLKLIEKDNPRWIDLYDEILD